jgi:hypothetical protein
MFTEFSLYVLQEGQKLGYDTEAFAIYDTMHYVKPAIHTLCVGNAWGEAALLLSSGEKVRPRRIFFNEIAILACALREALQSHPLRGQHVGRGRPLALLSREGTFL